MKRELSKERKPHSFCETPNEKCTMIYCDENGCLNRKRELVDPKQERNIDSETMPGFDERWDEFAKEEILEAELGKTDWEMLKSFGFKNEILNAMDAYKCKKYYLFSFKSHYSSQVNYLLVNAENEEKARELGVKQCYYNNKKMANTSDLKLCTYFS